MELIDYLRLLRKRWLSVVVFALVGVLAASTVTLTTQPSYQATTQIFVRTANDGSLAALAQGGTFTQSIVASYATVARTRAVLNPVVKSQKLAGTSEDLAARVTTDAPVNQSVISITVNDSSARRSARTADAIATSLGKWIETTQAQGSASGVSPVIASVVQPAVVPSSPSSPNARRNIVLGLLVGLVGGVLLAGYRESLDPRVVSEQDLQGFGVTVLGSVPLDTATAGTPVLGPRPRGPRAEAYRLLRTNLQFASAAHGAKSVLITSALREEGKTTTAINVAVALSRSGSRVALVDGDLHRPKVAQYLGVDGSAGLTTVLSGRSTLGQVLQPWGGTGLVVLPAGTSSDDPSELLATEGMAKLVKDMEGDYDLVIIDGAPLLPVTDSVVLAEMVDGVVIMAASGRTERPRFERALNSLRAVDARIFGAVLTMAPTTGPGAYAVYADGA